MAHTLMFGYYLYLACSTMVRHDADGQTSSRQSQRLYRTVFSSRTRRPLTVIGIRVMHALRILRGNPAYNMVVFIMD